MTNDAQHAFLTPLFPSAILQPPSETRTPRCARSRARAKTPTIFKAFLSHCGHFMPGCSTSGIFTTPSSHFGRMSLILSLLWSCSYEFFRFSTRGRQRLNGCATGYGAETWGFDVEYFKLFVGSSDHELHYMLMFWGVCLERHPAVQASCLKEQFGAKQ
jgi:hypothetical protein